MKLSNRQQSILDFIKHEVATKGYPPSVREICEAVGLASSSTVHGHLARLEKKGLIRRDPTKPRAIEILDNDQSVYYEKAVPVPVVGKVTAGVPISAVENIEEYFPVPRSMVDEKEVFILNVTGESMINAGIFDGDKVIVRRQSSAENGEIVVAMTDEDEATVKRFFKESDHIRLQPENPSMAPILLDHCVILGKVVGVFRSLK